MNISELSRPTTPESPLTSSLHDATSTIDDLTAALANFSRVPSPEPLSRLSCCCGRENCDHLQSWVDLKSRLDSRLVLSAEVGQALLQRHEAYVRQSERRLRDNDRRYAEMHESIRPQISNEGLQREFDEVMKEKAQCEKLLNQALVNNEVTEVSNKTILQELQDARDTISRLTAHHARSIGWDTRLSAALKERDDMQQERDGETHRARFAESRFAALKEKTAGLQAEVRRLQESLEDKRHSRLESSEHLLQDARSRIESVRNSQLGLTAKLAEDELTSVLESLVRDNEVLKHDNAELQHLLSESREDLHGLQEELEEQRANAPSRMSQSGANTPHSRHFHTGSVQSANFRDFTMFSPKGHQNGSAERMSRRRSNPHNIDVRFSPAPQSPPTPDTARSPTSFSDTLAPTEPKWASFGQASPGSSHVSFEVDEEAENEGSPTLFEKPRGHRPLLLLTRSRGVQTDGLWSGTLSPSPFPSHISSISPQDPRSESSSFSEAQSSHISTILERVVSLLNRITQADALTLTNRLKRQHLKGADVGHLSRSTVSNILAESASLRTQFRAFLEDEKLVTTCTRKDLRLLFKFIKDSFTELGQLRVTLNDIILDPSSAARVSELTLNPGKAEAEKKEREAAAQAGTAGWMAPISKLFSPTGRVEPVTIDRSLTRSASARTTTRPPRFVPKLGPALAASAMTVNVEFSGTGVGRAVTSTFTPQTVAVADSSTNLSSASQSVSSGLMGIFAGAPKPAEPADPWVVLPSGNTPTIRKASSFMRTASGDMATATIGRSVLRKSANRLSRNVDAVIDVERPQGLDEEPDFLAPLLERTLRRRGLSDSSIHSTFTSQGEDGRIPSIPSSPDRPRHASNSLNVGSPGRLAAWPDRSSVFQALSRTMSNFRQSAAGIVPSSALSREIVVPSHSRASSSRSSSIPRTNRFVPGVSTTLDRDDGTSIPATPTGAAESPLDAIAYSDSDPHSRPQTPAQKDTQPKPIRLTSPSRGSVLPNLAAWATSSMIDTVSGTDPFIVSSLRDESYMHGVSRNTGMGPRDEAHVRRFG